MVGGVVCGGLVVATFAIDLRVEVVATKEHAARIVDPFVYVADHVVDAPRVLASSKAARGGKGSRKLVELGIVHGGPAVR